MALRPAHDTSAPSHTTYGSFLADAATALEVAHHDATGPFGSADQAADVVGDFERLLAYTGRHLQLLLTPTTEAATRDGAIRRQLAAELAALPVERRGGNAWARAADALGTAHDLLATHLGPHGELRSPEATLLTSADLQLAAYDRVTDLIRTPLADAVPLLRQARATQPQTEPPLAKDTAHRVRLAALRGRRMLSHPAATTQPTGPTTGPASGRATGQSALLAGLDSLRPALTQIGDHTPPEALRSISTLHLLRQLVMRQSQGQEVANTQSLQDLCRVASSTCRTMVLRLPEATTPVGRVQRAAAIDSLRTATRLWDDLGPRLYPDIRGLSKAPGLYQYAVDGIAQEVAGSYVVTRAVLSCLPRLASESATTLLDLQRRGELVTLDKAPGQTTSRWAMLTPAAALDLADDYRSAGRATSRAAESVRRLQGQPAHRGPVPMLLTQRGRELEVEVDR